MPSLLPAQKIHPGLIFLVPYTAFLVFTGLGDSVLQVDEGADTFISTTILKYGWPMHSDGLNDTMLYADIYDGLFVYRTWLPYYIQALSLSLFGQNTFAARLPFALLGFFSVILLYIFTLKLTRKKTTAFLAAFFLASSVPALLYFQTARYIVFPVFLTLLLLYFYLDLFSDKKWNPLPFIVTSFLYFHSMYVEFSATVLGILIHFLIYRKTISPENARKVPVCAGVIAAFTLPWLIFIAPMFPKVSQLYQTNSPLVDVSFPGYFKHLAGYLFQANNYIFPFIFLPLLLSRKLGGLQMPIRLLGITLGAFFLIASIHPIPLQQYIAAALPLFYILLAVILTERLRGFPFLQVALAVILVTTNLFHVGPLLPFKGYLEARQGEFQTSPHLRHAYETFQREVRLSSAYFRFWDQMAHPYRGPLDGVVAFFRTAGRPGETCYIDNEPESLAYYTGMKLVSADQLDPESPPDWIVLRGDQRFLEKGETASPVTLKLRRTLRGASYRKIVLNAPVWRINNSYDIQLHLFQSPETADKVTIYQLNHQPFLMTQRLPESP